MYEYPRNNQKEKVFMPVNKLEPDALYRRCDADQFEFETTAELQDLAEIIGQPRVVEAVNFGIVFKIMVYWVLTVPAAAVTSMVIFKVLQLIL